MCLLLLDYFNLKASSIIFSIIFAILVPLLRVLVFPVDDQYLIITIGFWTILSVFGSIGLGLSIYFTTKQNNDRELKNETKKLELIRDKIKNQFQTVNSFDKYFNDFWKSKYRFAFNTELEKFEKKVNKDSKEFFKKIEELTKIRIELENNTIIPSKYRNENTIKALLALLFDKRADTLKELINLYEEILHREELLRRFSDLENSILDLSNNMHRVRREIIDVKYDLDDFKTDINGEVKNIIDYSDVMNKKISNIDASTKLIYETTRKIQKKIDK